MTASAGTLFVVATPIGNLEDLTFRALRTLREVDVVAAEDTRRTAKLLAHYEVRTPLLSVREHNEAREAPRLIDRLRAGASIALVTDAGTPGISDPGARVVRAVRDAGLKVVPVPGPSAVTAALSVAGCPADEFIFRGFPPPAGASRTAWFDDLASDPRPSVFFEAPHRVERTTGELRAKLSGREAFIFRELTKIHEECIHIATHDNSSISPIARGEFVIVVSGMQSEASARVFEASHAMTRAISIVGHLTDCEIVTREEAIVMAAALAGVRPSVLKRAVKETRYSGRKPSGEVT
jgi:16S rRNA (cytidine1402-2'-O)-methyltransferase